MHTRIDLVIAHYTHYQFFIADVSFVKRDAIGNGLTVAINQIVENDNFFAAFFEIFDSNTSDISGTAGY